MITGIAHINLIVPEGTLDQAEEFYSGILGFIRVPVPLLQKDRLAWFDITPKGQQIHIAFGPPEQKSSRHPCFKIDTQGGLLELQRNVWDHHVRGGKAAALEADKPGEENSGAKGVEYPSRFFARDYAGNRLEFSL
ncbi:Glyoxalase/Bleomycin resistance protein/Dihydroxybiphenyl dioxygenase [Glarea lozoyensis ATCC 20868]|uniref:Glyoxalase/Bleomycin resistance protein/Dihydroxybiphenyl dioxygenase n=1 Tax=Glarea lozoyensis (strain ATCC 20868 / MF5171) TaxID=1116229 RepID=S3DE75_GLAL2|nr:Glyoxalase/Bleomycin resistance protein/Dihydroxybiphenyl dioxygenase [Glarea lozoyensis ATCC 20868]EPE35399.1 Glyoxalase/Bleomycin resistance protein/Dihydroxybiphenyl dioxygenase [Glarea lozoyensis ATCC 20868]